MKQNRNSLIYEIEKGIDTTNPQNVAKRLYTVHDIPLNISTGILLKQKSLTKENDFILYCFAEIITPKLVPEYYMDYEIEKYSKQKYEVITINWPIEFDMIQVTEEQWIGTVSVDYLMKLKQAGLLICSENNQRAMRHVVRGEKDYWTVALSKESLKKIKATIEEGIYIPNTISLNINTNDESANFKYNVKQKRLVVNKINAFEIIDGFHRYMAFSQIYDDNPEFDFPPIELRIFNSNESKIKQFLYQELQKVPVKAATKELMNQHDLHNTLVRELNQDSNCNLQGLIKDGSLISPGVLAAALRIYKIENRKEMLNLLNVIEDKFNDLIKSKPDLLDGTLTEREITIIIYGFYKEMTSDVILRAIKLGESTTTVRDFRLTHKTILKSKWDIVEKLYKAVM